MSFTKMWELLQKLNNIRAARKFANVFLIYKNYYTLLKIYKEL
ncbi:hypothetical protein LEP1GSC073_4370 [Leptospira noguchii str. Cascata]|nr:hypothetical protein LEP1GSC073_4370 [Leptospira noguchii str. Cascata]